MIEEPQELNTATMTTGGFSWESRYAQSWQVLQEDEEGSLQPTLAMLLQRQSHYLQRRREAAEAAVRRGIMRHVVLLIDWSQMAAQDDLQPCRAVWTLTNAVRPFLYDYFEQNPLGQLGLLLLRDGLCERAVDLVSSLSVHESAIERLVMNANRQEEKGAEELMPRGDLSLQNGLQVAHALLSHVPSHGTREVLFLQTSLSTVDPGDIYQTMSLLPSAKIRFSVISLWGQTALTGRLARQTGGESHVALDERHFIQLVREQVTPPPILARDARTTSYLVPMGFPSRVASARATLCICHAQSVRQAYRCPRCLARLCRLPMDCPICQLTLVSSPHLARSYHHLFPVPSYEGHHLEGAKLIAKECYSCHHPLNTLDPPCAGYSIGQCSRCNQHFCPTCNHFTHEMLFNCPGCLATPH